MYSRKPLAIAVAVSAAIVSHHVVADNTPDYSKSRAYTELRSEDSAYQVRASDLIGADVISVDNDDVGDVDDLVVPRGGSEPLAVMEIGGFLGMGEKVIAVPVSALRIDDDGDEVYLDITEDQVEAMDEFDYLDGELTGRQRLTMRSEAMELRGGISRAADSTKRAADETTEEIKAAWLQVKAGWGELKVAAQERWNQLTDDDVEQIDGERNDLLERLHARYNDRDPQVVEEEMESWRRGQIN